MSRGWQLSTLITAWLFAIACSLDDSGSLVPDSGKPDSAAGGTIGVGGPGGFPAGTSGTGGDLDGGTDVTMDTSLDVIADGTVSDVVDAPVVWKPTDFSGCALWLDAADASSLATTGVNVDQWTNKCGPINATSNG